MRIRQIKPAFWGDSKIAELPEPTRLFYVGLWMIADDAGWLRWDAVEVSRDLYGYDGRARRERRVAAMFTALVEAGRVTLHPCGHAQIPTMPEHQHLAALDKQVRTVLKDHSRECHPETREDPRKPAETRLGKERVMVGEGNGSSWKGSAAALLSQRDEEDRAEVARLAAQGRLPRPRAVS